MSLHNIDTEDSGNVNNQSNANGVALLGYYGGDMTHCLSAWQSTAFDENDLAEVYLDDNKEDSLVEYLFKSTSKDRKRSPESLLHYLAQEGHHTPFEKSSLHFQVRADIATHIHFLKHRIGVSINTESARYKELTDKWYLPEDWLIYDGAQIDFKKLVHSVLENEDHDTKDDLVDVLNWYAQLGHELYHQACDVLTPLVGRKRAKETARYFLPYCKQVDFDVMFNFRSFMHFQKLRNSKDAQVEVRTIAEEMLQQIKALPDNPFALSLKAFGF